MSADDRLGGTEMAPDPRERRVFRAFDRYFAEAEPLPPGLVAAAQDLYVWRSVDAELLELLVDSAEQELTTVRNQRLQRFMAFGGDDRGVHFELAAETDGFTLEGTVVPSGRYEVRLDRPGFEMIVQTDDFGMFRMHDLSAGSTRLTIRSGIGDLLMTTPWFVLQA